MNAREVIKRNLSFKSPQRIGLNFGGEGRRNDIMSVKAQPTDWQQRRWNEGRFEYYDDEWGNIWFRVADMGAGGEIFTPAIQDWSMLKDLRLPDMANPRRFENVRKAFASSDLFRMGGLPGFPFAICRYLRKMENYFQDLILEREHIDELHDKVTSLLEEIMTQYAAAGADGVFFCEDWGIQDRLLISPPMWREIFKPLFVRLCAKARGLGLFVLMHSCGYNWDILDDLAEAGVNAFQFDQPALYGLERLSQKLRSLKVCLYSPVDVQRVLPTGNRELIVDNARKMCELFGGPEGGFIARNYGDLKGIGVQPEWDKWAYDTFVEMASDNKDQTNSHQ